MCVQIGNRLFLSCVWRVPDCVRAGETAPFQLPYAPEKSLFQMGFRSEAFLGRLDGLTGRSARTRDLVRLGKKVLGGSGETGGWAKASRVGAAGGALAQRDAKRGMNSCDVLLFILSGILSGRAESIKVARSGAKLPREFVCCFALSAKIFADWRSVSRRLGRRYGLATMYVL